MNANIPSWVLEVIFDLAIFAKKNAIDELSCDLEQIHMKHTGNRRDAEIYDLIIDASFGKDVTVRR